jgi:hypothetical protein
VLCFSDVSSCIFLNLSKIVIVPLGLLPHWQALILFCLEFYKADTYKVQDVRSLQDNFVPFWSPKVEAKGWK